MATVQFLPSPGVPDDVLTQRIQSGDHAAFNLLHSRYEPWLRQLAHRYFLLGAAHEDLVQLARVGLWQAALRCRPQSGSVFRAWAKFIIHRQITGVIRQTSRHAEGILGPALSLSAPAAAMPDSLGTLEDAVVDAEPSIEEAYVARDHVDGFCRALAQQLTPLERQVLGPLLAHRSMADTMRVTGCTFKQVDNARQRIRQKARALRREEDPAD